MKKIIIAGIASLLLVGVAGAYTLSNSYKAVYCYPTGTYWQKQLSNPWNVLYYTVHNSYYTAHYGAGSAYCN